MNAYETAHDPSAVSEEGAPLDLVFAQHNLQKLNLASSHNEPHLRACIAHQLGVAEQVLLGRARDPGSVKHLEEIAEARNALERAPH